MYGQGNYAPQFRQGPPTHPPPFQQGTRPFQQGPPPPPLPPLVNHQIRSAAPPHVVQPSHHHSIYQQGPPPSLPRPSQPYLHPLPPRVFLPSHSQGQMAYVNPRHPPPPSIGQGSQHGQLVPPPPPSFIPVTPAPFASIPQAPSGHAHPPSLPPPPPPPPPPSPPPLFPSPPASASFPEFSSKSSIMSSFTPLNASSSMPHNLERDRTSDDLPACGDYPTIHGGTSCDMSKVEDRLPSETQSPLVLPPIPAAKEVVRQIEVLCQYIVKNGPAFEVAARRKEHGNPKFSFLFGGEPGSEAAIAYDYFQWMKRKCLKESKSRNGSEQSDLPLRPSEAESSKYLNRFTNENASHSPGDSDMDMEDDTAHLNKDQGIGASVELPKEFILTYNLKEQQFESTTRNASSRIESTYDMTLLSKNEREYDHISSRSSVETSECTFDANTQKSTELVDDFTEPKASPAAAAAYKDNLDPVSKIGSPFRLIQDYASDDSGEADDGARFEDVSPERVSPSNMVNTNLHENEGTNLETNNHSFSTSISEKGSTSLTVSSSLCRANMPNIGMVSPKVVAAIHVASGSSDVSARNNELQNDSHECRNDLVHRDSLRGDGETSGKFQRGGGKQGSAARKVDEFGRIVREGVNDSDSDAEHYKERRYRRGRSRSPLDRRRRRSRSPRRRYERRHRSRSWSPRKRRSVSKSRSPSAFRNTRDLSGDKMRRDRDQKPECIDFSKGRCRRGASCRFPHRGSETGDVARRYRGRQQQHVEAPQDLRKSVDNVVQTKNERVTMEEDITRTKMPWSDVIVSSNHVPKERGLDEKIDAVPFKADSQPVTSVGIGESATSAVAYVGQSYCQGAIEQGIEVQKVSESQAVQDNEISELPEEINIPLATQPPNGSETRDISGRTPSIEPLLDETAVCRVSEANVPNGKVSETSASVYHGEQSLHTPNTTTSLPFLHESFASQYPAAKEFHPLYYSAGNYQFQHSQLPLPPPPPPPLVTAQVSQPLRDYNLPPVATSVYPQSASVDNRPPYQAPLNNQYSQSPAPSKHSWTSLQPPPASVHGSTNTAVSQIQGFHPMQFQQYPAPLMRPYQHGAPSHSQANESHPPTFPSTGDFQGPALLTEGIQNQSFEDPKVLRDERFSHPSVLDGNRFSCGPSQVLSMHSQHQVREEHHVPLQVSDGSPNFQTLPNQRFTSLMAQDMCTEAVPFSNESTVKQLQTFPDGNSHRLKEFGTPAANYSFTQQQQHQPSFGMQWSGSSNFPSHLGSAENICPSIRRYPLSLDDGKTSHLSAPGGSRISAHFNPFASTFDNVPDGSKYNSNFKQNSLINPISRYDSLAGIQASPSDSSRLGAQSLRKSGDPYDPLFDSVEPSLKASGMFGCGDGGNLTSDVSRMSVAAQSTNSLTGSKEQIAVGERTSSPENDEFGETAIDTEVGAMDSGSPDNPSDRGDKAMGDVEIDQVQSKGKSKKSKDSRSMKLFKVALADFVKDLLKPSWRQGNMSKEAFKTIVKKTVDKVAGAMKNHQIPKGHVKINHYVESSQRKLTKLVMGYVDKYVKA
ncbi:Zinc finger ccch domain-containing protein [Thalictrum thalictroides]|uniref:Zinc finger ccch domain-containing protein n=1 Tax=Thalictrum thalictroides TaxID=46969 RepID=A0A7J6VM28_THATH|nr:Zinc finger ccch domain-containing protein [Thalictrum thalictroides]